MATIGIVFPKTLNIEYLIENTKSNKKEKERERERERSKNPNISYFPQEQECYISSWIDFIIENYSNLTDYVLFLGDKPVQYSKFDTLESLLSAVQKHPDMFLDKTQWLHVLKCNETGYPHHPNLHLNDAFVKVFKNSIPKPDVFEFVHGGQAFFSQRRILSRPLTFYENLKDLMQNKTIDYYTSERLWHYI